MPNGQDRLSVFSVNILPVPDLEDIDHQPIVLDGYNVGVNVGEAAGQTVMHLHVHVIPRYAGGDVADPPGGRGGAGGAVPKKRVY